MDMSSNCSLCGSQLCPHIATRTNQGIITCIYCGKPPESLYLPVSNETYDRKSKDQELVCKTCYQKHIYINPVVVRRETKKDSQDVLRACKDILNQFIDGQITSEELMSRTNRLLEDIEGRGQLNEAQHNSEGQTGGKHV